MFYIIIIDKERKKVKCTQSTGSVRLGPTVPGKMGGGAQHCDLGQHERGNIMNNLIPLAIFSDYQH